MKNNPNLALLCAFMLFCVAVNAQAARHAVLIGVGSYPGAALEGPINDVKAIKSILIGKWGFTLKNTQTLSINRVPRKIYWQN